MSEEMRWPVDRDLCQIEGEYRPVGHQGKIPCLIVNLSERGAGLEMPDHTDLPERFYLSLPLLPELSEERLVELRWQKGSVAGVLFV